MGATKQAVDFTNVKEGGNFSKRRMPMGDYLAKITKVEDAQNKDKNDKTPMWLFTFQLVKMKSATYPYYCKLQENQLWKVRNMLVAAGITVPKRRVAVDPNKLVGKLVAISLDDAEYESKEQSEIVAVFSPNDLEGDSGVDSELDTDDDVDEPDEEEVEAEEEEEEAPAPKKKKAPEPEPVKKKKKSKPAEAEADDEIDIEDLD